MVAANNGIYNTVGASISGVTNTLTVTNASNTASSAARETIVVGGGTAGDPTINWNVSGVTNFEMGLDNSDSDKLKISQGTALGTNDTWIMTTAGQRTMPLQSCFKAISSVDLTNVTGDGTVYTIILDSDNFDQNSNYNTATGVFTAPVAGKYLFIASIWIEGLSLAFNDASLQINGTVDGNFMWTGNPGVMRNASADQLIINASMTLNLAAGSAVTLILTVSGSTKTITIKGGSNASVYSGFLIA